MHFGFFFLFLNDEKKQLLLSGAVSLSSPGMFKHMSFHIWKNSFQQSLLQWRGITVDLSMTKTDLGCYSVFNF